MSLATEGTDPRKVRRRPQHNGSIALTGIGYFIGSRLYVITVPTVTNYVDMVGPRENWDPLTLKGTNRKEDKAHVREIAEYVTDQEDYVLNSVVCYVDKLSDVEWVPDDPEAPISPGVLYLRPSAKLKVGDGGHRTTAFQMVLAEDVIGVVSERLARTGQPCIVVLDDNTKRRAEDFALLQKNSKPLNASIAESMDQTQQINEVLVQQVIKGGEVPLFGVGERVEFMSDTPGKLSPKFASYKAIRYASGTLLIGTSQRSAKGWDEAVATVINGNTSAVTAKLIEFWRGFSELPDVAKALHAPAGTNGMLTLRSDTLLTSAYIAYALAAAVWRIITDDPAQTVAEVMAHAKGIDFSRTAHTFDGTLMEPAEVVGGKETLSADDRRSRRMLTGRDAWEGAAEVIYDLILQSYDAEENAA